MTLLEDFPRTHRVTSDCRPWSPGGQLGVCPHCGTVQKPDDPQWRADSQAIYESYHIYAASGGREQGMANADGATVARSSLVIERLLKTLKLPESARLLDIGCGNGAFLRVFNDKRPGWDLTGSEFDDRHQPAVLAIGDNVAFTTEPVARIAGEFDLVTLNHVFEHAPDPILFLTALKMRIAPGGVVMIQVPDLEHSPFDLLVADHGAHYHREALLYALRRAGYEILYCEQGWYPKEMTLIARPRDERVNAPTPAPEWGAQLLNDQWRWLSLTAQQFSQYAERELYLFGTAIAATWLYAQLGETARGFVVDDPAQIGGSHCGKPVLAAKDLPARAVLLMAFPPGVGETIAARIVRPDILIVQAPQAERAS
ncbi:putative type 11 methyltransferase [Magnetofaba australis IT-1]|uniref:Putative type 11 methyltransferase n=1 Tax=Magnetofaba australis IT-1 TaxID=1434232 RepID=A0A1Y2K4A9_9PROT|nr:putative type 11 methyltransferase [Magnetofaba australis IT-1]